MTLVDAPTKTKASLHLQYKILCPHCGADRRELREMLASKNAEEREEAVRTIGHCHFCANALYEPYRKVIGKCETCGALMATHPRCKACSILCGSVHEHFLSTYRGHEICGPCIKAWKGLEKFFGRDMTWSEFAHPVLHRVNNYGIPRGD